ncbi:hypothetical protein D3C71_1461920 [compost metagenome]
MAVRRAWSNATASSPSGLKVSRATGPFMSAPRRAISAASSCLRWTSPVSEMSWRHVSAIPPGMSMTVRLSSWPGPFMAFSRLTRPQPITSSGAVWRVPSSFVAVVSSTCGAAIEVPV